MQEAHDGQDCGLMIEIIRAGALAGAYAALARDIPDAQAGLIKMAVRHSIRAATLMDELIAEAEGLESPASASMPGARRDGA